MFSAFLARHIVQPLRDFVFSTKCFHCGAFLQHNEERLCGACWSSLRRVQANDHTLTIMQKRFADAGIVDGFYPLYYFEKHGVFQTLAHNLKYREMQSFGFALGKKLGASLQAHDVTLDCIIPVPLHAKKFRERGYNQAEVIAGGVSSIIAVPVKTNIVTRIRYTQTQTALHAEQRKENVANAFAVRNAAQIAGKKILLVDDVVTTGATIHAIAAMVKNSGAAKTFVASAGLAELGEDG